jgi:NAD+ kinase
MKVGNLVVFLKGSEAEEYKLTVNAIKEVVARFDVKVRYIEKTGWDQGLDGNDLILSVGGDGTFLKAVHLAGDSIVCGVNANPATNEGALCSVTREDLEPKLTRLFDGDFGVDELTRARVRLVISGRSYHALNDIYFGSERSYHTSRYVIKSAAIREAQKSSGIIISTKTGATAWYASAGGDRSGFEADELRFLVREPYSGRLTKPLLTGGTISGDEKLYLSPKMPDPIIAIDSLEAIHLNDDEEVEVSVSNRPARVVAL